MLAYGVAPRRSQVPAGHGYASRDAHRFYPPSATVLFVLRGARHRASCAGLARAYCAKLRHPATSGKASLPLPHCATYCKGFTSGYAALANVLQCVAPPSSPRRNSLRAALRAAGFSAALRFASGVCVPHPAALIGRTLRCGLRGALAFPSNHSPRPRHHWQGGARLSLGGGCWLLTSWVCATFQPLFADKVGCRL